MREIVQQKLSPDINRPLFNISIIGAVKKFLTYKARFPRKALPGILAVWHTILYEKEYIQNGGDPSAVSTAYVTYRYTCKASGCAVLRALDRPTVSVF